jgi:hypothetical protein
MAQTPASIRYNNPGAQYPGASAKKFGTLGTEIIGGGHKIAVFDDPVKGAAAQFDLLDRGYTNMTVADAIRKWSGGNFSQPYAQYLTSNVPGLTLDTVLTPDKLRDPSFAVPFAKASASWEAGRPYPMTDEQWQNAHRLSFGGSASDPRNTTPSGGGYGVDPDGAYGVAGAIQTPDVGDAGITTPQTQSPASAPLTGSQQGMGMLADTFDANESVSGGDVFKAVLGGLGGMGLDLSQVPQAKVNLQMVEAKAPKVDLSGLSQAVRKRKWGV